MLGSVFADRRRELGREIEDVGARVGLSRSTMFRIEKGHAPQFEDHVRWLGALCSELGLDPAEVLAVAATPKPKRRKR